MTLQNTDLGVYLTTTSGSAGSSLSQGNPSASLGKYASTTPLVSGQTGALFSTVTAAQAGAGYTDYRCIAVRNLSGADTALASRVFINDPTGGATYWIGLDPAGITNYNNSGAQGTSTPDTLTAPTGVSFALAPSTSPLTIGDLAPGKVALVWIKRVVDASTPGTTADLVTFSVRGDTV